MIFPSAIATDSNKNSNKSDFEWNSGSFTDSNKSPTKTNHFDDFNFTQAP
jgi:hypothetical protein